MFSREEGRTPEIRHLEPEPGQVAPDALLKVIRPTPLALPSIIQPQYITKVTGKPQGDLLNGVVSFRCSGFYEGDVPFKAKRIDGTIPGTPYKIIALSLGAVRTSEPENTRHVESLLREGNHGSNSVWCPPNSRIPVPRIPSPEFHPSLLRWLLVEPTRRNSRLISAYSDASTSKQPGHKAPAVLVSVGRLGTLPRLDCQAISVKRLDGQGYDSARVSR